MGIDDMLGKAKQAFEQNKDKINDAIHSDQAEEVSDNILDKVSGFAKSVLPESAHEHIDNARNAVDAQIGNDAQQGNAATPPANNDGVDVNLDGASVRPDGDVATDRP